MPVIPTPGAGTADFTEPGLPAGDAWDLEWIIEVPIVADPDPDNDAHWSPYNVSGALWRSQIREGIRAGSLLLGEFDITIDTAAGVNVLRGRLDPLVTTELGKRKDLTVFYDLQAEDDDSPRTWIRGQIRVIPESTVIVGG